MVRVVRVKFIGHQLFVDAKNTFRGCMDGGFNRVDGIEEVVRKGHLLSRVRRYLFDVDTHTMKSPLTNVSFSVRPSLGA